MPDPTHADKGPVGVRAVSTFSLTGPRMQALALVLAAVGFAGAVVHAHWHLDGAVLLGVCLASGSVLLGWNWDLQRRLMRRNRALERSEAQIRATLQAIPDLLFELDRDGRYLAVQALNPQLLFVEEEQFLGRTVAEVMPAAAAAACMQALKEAESEGSSHGHQLLVPLPDGDRWFELSVARKQALPGVAMSFVVLSRDIHDRKSVEAELQRQIKFYEVLSRCNGAILTCRSEQELLDHFCEEAVSTGLLRMAWIGLVDPGSDAVQPVAWAGDGIEYLHGIQISTAAASPYGQGPVGTSIRENRPVWCQDFQHDAATAAWHERGARYHWGACASLPLHRNGQAAGALTIYAGDVLAFTADVQKLLVDIVADLDLALDRFRGEAERQHLAHMDQLTGLANRELLQQEFKFLLATCLREKEPVAVMVVNLDRFQLINDSLGSDAGDQLLVEVARRLRHRLRESDVIARVGGDEFLIVLPNLQPRDAAIVAAALQQAIVQPWRYDGGTVAVTASIGIAMAPDDGQEPDLLARKANLALHEVKQTQPNSFRFFTEDLQARTARTMQLSNALRFAIEKGELSLVYQPQVVTATGAVVGAEALLRWQHSELGAICPGEFIPLAESNGLIHPIGDWVLQQVIAQLRAWMAAGITPPRMAVNLSARQFRRPELADQIATLLSEAAIPGELLEVELTETATMECPQQARRTIEKLGQLGVSFAIDDFGTGYASLSNLSLIKAHKLKIDASFVRELTTNPDSRAILRATLTMARAMGMRTLAEGVEHREELAFLEQHGCDEIQGYLFARPMAPEAFIRYVTAQLPGIGGAV